MSNFIIVIDWILPSINSLFQWNVPAGTEAWTEYPFTWLETELALSQLQILRLRSSGHIYSNNWPEHCSAHVLCPL